MSIFDRPGGFHSPRDHEIQERRRKVRQEVDSLLSRGLVERVFLLPREFGGIDDPRNVTYLPPLPAAQKRAFDARVRARVESGQALTYRARPEYDDDSLVPARLHLEAVGGPTELREIVEVAPHRNWKGRQP